MQIDSRVFVAGHRGMVGSAIVRNLRSRGFTRVLTVDRTEVDLRNETDVSGFFQRTRPDYVILAAAKVGGIQANMSAPTEFLLENLKIQNNVIMAAFEHGAKKFCFLGSSCIYPRESPQPMKEEYLLQGPLEPTNEGYALAKIAGLRLVQYLHRQHGFNGINLMPCNLYGRNDSFDLLNSHVLSAMVRKICDAVETGLAEVTMWGTGSARREFMNVEDLADAVYFFMESYDSPELINVGWGTDISIKDLAAQIATQAGFLGQILWDSSRPDGMPRKCMDVSRMTQLGYKPKIALDRGIETMIAEYAEYRKRS